MEDSENNSKANIVPKNDGQFKSHSSAQFIIISFIGFFGRVEETIVFDHLSIIIIQTRSLFITKIYIHEDVLNCVIIAMHKFGMLISVNV